MSGKFFSKGRGSSRKVIPIHRAWQKFVARGSTTPPFQSQEYWMAVPGAVRIMKALENAEAVILDQEDLLQMDVDGITEEDVKKIPELEKVKAQLKAATTAIRETVIPALSEVTGWIRFEGEKKSGLGTAVQAFETKFWAAIHDGYMAQATLEEIMKKRNDNRIMTVEGYSLGSISADIEDATSSMDDAVTGVQRAYIETMKEDYQRVKEFRQRQRQDGTVTIDVTFKAPNAP